MLPIIGLIILALLVLLALAARSWLRFREPADSASSIEAMRERARQIAPRHTGLTVIINRPTRRREEGEE